MPVVWTTIWTIFRQKKTFQTLQWYIETQPHITLNETSPSGSTLPIDQEKNLPSLRSGGCLLPHAPHPRQLEIDGHRTCLFKIYLKRLVLLESNTWLCAPCISWPHLHTSTKTIHWNSMKFIEILWKASNKQTFQCRLHRPFFEEMTLYPDESHSTRLKMTMKLATVP